MLGADTIDYQKPYQAAGLDKSIPWYQVKGSHDNFWFGSTVVTESLGQTYIGENLLCAGDVLADPLTGFGQHLYYMGTVDGSTQYGDIIGAGPVDTTKQIQVAADPNRRSLNMCAWMNEFFNTSSRPLGHGFSMSNLENEFASYSFDPKPNIPITVIMLDDTQSEKETGLASYGNGALNQARYDWLVKSTGERPVGRQADDRRNPCTDRRLTYDCGSHWKLGARLLHTRYSTDCHTAALSEFHPLACRPSA